LVPVIDNCDQVLVIQSHTTEGDPQLSRSIGTTHKRLGVLLGAALLWIAFTATALACYPVRIDPACIADGSKISWQISSSLSEPDMRLEFATNANFDGYSTYVLDSYSLSTTVVTDSSVQHVWVRWHMKQSVVSDSSAPTCTVPPTPSRRRCSARCATT